MKRTVLPFFSFILVLVLLLASFGTAKAGAGDDPVVTPVSGDLEFTTEVISIASLPGVTELAGGMLVPVGFPAGEAQFGGNGVLVTGMDHGTATACFSLSSTAIAEGWGGKVGVWNGTKWVQLPTTITTPVDSPNSLGCATITGSGTYAFIKYVVDPSLLPKTFKPLCSFSVGWLLSGYGSNPTLYLGITTPNTYPPSGTPFSWAVDSATPPGVLMGPSSGSAVIGSEDVFNMFLTSNIGPYFDSSGQTPEFNMRVDFAECFALMHFGGTS